MLSRAVYSPLEWLCTAYGILLFLNGIMTLSSLEHGGWKRMLRFSKNLSGGAKSTLPESHKASTTFTKRGFHGIDKTKVNSVFHFMLKCAKNKITASILVCPPVPHPLQPLTKPLLALDKPIIGAILPPAVTPNRLHSAGRQALNPPTSLGQSSSKA